MARHPEGERPAELRSHTSTHLELVRAGLLSKRTLSLAFVVLALGIALTVLLRSLVQERALRTEQVRFERRASQLTHTLQGAFEVPMEVLHSIPSLFDASESVERHEFRTFVRRPLGRWPEIYALEWFPRVSGSERAKYESAARSDGLADFQFTRTGEGGHMLRAEPRAEHFPLYFMEPSNPIAVGFDLASEDMRVGPVLKARDSGQPVMSPRIRLVEDAATIFSIAAFSPVYAGGTPPNDLEARRLSFRGVAAVVFRIKAVVARVLRDGDLAGSDFVLRDRDAPAALTLLHETRPGLGRDFSTEVGSALVAVHRIELCDRHWEVEFRSPAPALVGNWVLAGGALVSLLLSFATAGTFALLDVRRRMKRALRLGQYTLVEKIGEGGMGVVYRARHALLSRPTAIKLLPGEVDSERLRRFEREAQLTSELTHPNTVVVYDYGRTSTGTLYFVMEYLDGVTFEELVRSDGPQPPRRVVNLLLQICGALREAHAVGLIHRDVKPANLMLTRRGQVPDFVKVLDFGLVKQIANADTLGLSGTQTLLGTPAYLSPESITNPQNVDGRSDLYSLGAVAYFMLTAELVFDAKTVIEMCDRHLRAEPVPPSVRAGISIPHSLERIVLRCLAKAQEDRFQSATELEEALLGCTELGVWSREDAERWWRSRERVAVETASGEASDESRTVAVDFEAREERKI